MLHLAAVEVLYSTWRLDGTPPLGPWDAGSRDTDEGWTATFDIGDRHAAQVYAMCDEAAAASRARTAAFLEAGSLTSPVNVTAPTGERASLRRLLFDLLEEYGRHTGHADPPRLGAGTVDVTTPGVLADLTAGTAGRAVGLIADYKTLRATTLRLRG